MAIRWEKLTVKSQQAMQQAQERAAELGNPEIAARRICCWRCVEDREGVIPAVLEKIGVPTERLENDLHQIEEKLPRVAGSAAQPGLSQALNKVVDQAFKEAANFKDEYVSTEHLLLGVAQPEGRSGARRAGRPRRNARGDSEGADRRARIAARDRPESRRQIPGARKIRQGSDRTGAPRQARPGDRPRRRDSPRHPGAEPPHQEQSGADRRTRRGQDRHRRRTRAPHRFRRRAREPARTSASSRSTSARCWPAQSIAASLKTASRPC